MRKISFKIHVRGKFLMQFISLSVQSKENFNKFCLYCLKKTQVLNLMNFNFFYAKVLILKYFVNFIVYNMIDIKHK